MTRQFASFTTQIAQRPWPLFVLLALALYGPFLDNPLIFDDRLYLRPEIAEFPDSLTSRWIHRLTLWVDATYLDLNFSHARLINVLIHIANAAILFQLVMTWSRIAEGSDSSHSKAAHAAFISALLFCVHPAAVYAVGYLTQRSILLATMFGLLALLLHTKAQTTRKPALFISSAFCVFASMFSKEHSVMLPAVLSILTWWLHRNGYPWCKQWAPAFAAYFSASLLTVHYVSLAPTSLYEPHTTNLAWLPEHPYLSSVLAQGLLFFKYVGFWLLPDPRSMSIDLHSDLPYQTISWIGLVSILATGGLLTLLVVLIRRGGYASLIGFAGLYAALLFATELWVVRLSESIVIYRSYLWMVFTPFIIASLLITLAERLHISAASRIVAITMIAALLFFGAQNRLHSMSSTLIAWSESVARNASVKNPAAARPYMNVGVYTGDEKMRMQYYELALAANPSFGPAYVNMGRHFIMQNNLEQALESFRKGKITNPTNLEARLGMGEVLQLMNRSEEALIEYKDLLKSRPTDLRVMTDMAAANLRIGHIEDAVQLLEHVISTQKPSDVAYFNLALAYEKRGDTNAALKTVSSALTKHSEVPLLIAYEQYLRKSLTTQASPSKRSWMPRISRPMQSLQ